MLTIGSLFSGIGGLELGLEWAGLGPVLWQVEQSDFCRRVLAKHWPAADRSVSDVRVDSALVPVDLVCLGFPCQDVSVAGDGAGLDGERSGLWFDALRIIGGMLPRWVVVENVAHGRSRYLCEVRSGLQELGYRTTALLVSALECGAPHVRDRCFVVADSDGEQVRERAERDVPGRPAVPPTGEAEPGYACGPDGGAAQSGVGRGAHGVPARLDGDRARPSEPLRWPSRMGEPRFGWEPPIAAPVGAFHDERLTALGNAVSPVCAARGPGRFIVEAMGTQA